MLGTCCSRSAILWRTIIEWRPPGALGGDARAALLAEVAELEQSGRLSRRRAGTSAAAKERDDRICWLEGGARRQPLLGSLALQLGEIAARLFPGQRPLLRPRRAMLAVYDGGGARYVRHRDNELEQGRWMNFRSVTAICYQRGASSRAAAAAAGCAPSAQTRRTRSRCCRTLARIWCFSTPGGCPTRCCPPTSGGRP
ncbi:unnamed protein product [Prorocentrum cordatum]|uniref:Uncharacterized protein n=1 Tax=Prorocentrum cordatum TaxID=2364126 RepID=A0ABN9XI19_9DINO|nr:unnamed protein product [Polarella glacialis]